MNTMEPNITAIIYNVFEGLHVTVIGVLVVFGILGLLATILYSLKYLQPEPKPEPLKKPVEEKAEAVEKAVAKSNIQVLEEISREDLAIATAAIAMFNEYKMLKLQKYDVFKEFPELVRLLPMAGILFKAYFRVSLGGPEKEVVVEELGGGTYRVSIGSKTYTVVVKP